MLNYETTINGKSVVFTNEGIHFGESIYLEYKYMSEIGHRGGEKPAFVFKYKGQKVELPYNVNDKNEMMQYFKYAASLEKKDQEEHSLSTQLRMNLLEIGMKLK